MMRKCYFMCTTLLVLAVLPALAHATARLTNVTAVSGGCVSGPTGPAVQHWDTEPGETYTLKISDVFECANNGTDPTLDVRINSETHGNTDIVATNVAPGVYEFDYTLPLGAVCTFPIFYCTTPGAGNSGTLVIRDDGVNFQAHLRSASFEPGCTNPSSILGPACQTVPVKETSWGAIKALFE